MNKGERGEQGTCFGSTIAKPRYKAHVLEKKSMYVYPVWAYSLEAEAAEESRGTVNGIGENEICKGVETRPVSYPPGGGAPTLEGLFLTCD